VDKESLIEKLTYEQRPEGSPEKSHVDILGRTVPDGGSARYIGTLLGTQRSWAFIWRALQCKRGAWGRDKYDLAAVLRKG